MAAHYDYDQIDEKLYREYTNEVLNSEGFYVLSEYGSKVICGITKVDRDVDSDMFKKAEMAAEFAVEKYNKENSEPKLKFVKVLNVNMEATAGKVFYITLAAMDTCDDDVKHFQAKVWAKINTGFQVQIFRPAPYEGCNLERSPVSFCIRVNNLEAWMDENYLYYKCFWRSAKQLLKVKVERNAQTGEPEGHGLLEFRSFSEAAQVLRDYEGTVMPNTSRCYKLEGAHCFST